MCYSIGFIFVLALGLVGCSETAGTGGSGGDGGVGGDGGDGGTGGMTGQEFPCTEQGIRDAIAEGDGPHTFACDGPTTLTIASPVTIDNDVILDAEGQLTLDGNRANVVFGMINANEITAELRGFRITGGPGPQALGDPGAIFLLGLATLTLVDSTVSEGEGVGIHSRGTLALLNSIVSGNAGSGILNVGTLTLSGSSVSDNVSGGIDNEGTLTLNSSRVEALFSSGPMTITNSTVGSVFTTAGLTLTSSTVVGDLLLGADDSESTVTSSLVSGLCECGEFGQIDCSDIFTSNGYNIESPSDTCGFDQATDQVDVSAVELNLGPLQNNDGPTETHALGAGSVAIDQIPEAACEVETDQRGKPRPEPGGTTCDVGAFEVQP
jgi:hypothetical protein